MRQGLALRLGPQGGPMLPARVRSILNKYPEGDAHLFIPGAAIPVLGPELVVNGDFSGGANGWGFAFGASVVSGAGRFTATADKIYQLSATFAVGKTYQVRFNKSVDGSLAVYVGLGIQMISTTSVAGGNVATFTSANVGAIYFVSNGFIGTIDNISVREVLSYTDRISNFSAGNYFDTAGTTGATVDQTVGRVNDAAGKLGVELVTNGDFASDTTWVKEAGWTISGGEARATAAADGMYVYQSPPKTLGKTYLVTYTCTSFTAGGFRFNLGGAVSTVRSSTGTFSELLTVVNAGFTYNGIRATAPSTTATFDNISVKEVIGTHATQGTTANMPTLRKAGGLYSWEFDGTTDYFKLDAPLFGMADDHCVIAGAAASSLTATRHIFNHTNSDTQRLCDLVINVAGQAAVNWRDDASTLAAPNDTVSYPAGTPLVITGIKVGNNKNLRVNGVQRGATNTTVLGTTTVTGAVIGAYQSSGLGFFAGNLYPLIAIKGTVSPADVVTLERFISKLSGVTL